MHIRRTLSRLRNALRPRRARPVILMYHRVASVIHDPWGLAVSPQRFDQQMCWLQQHRIPLPMTDFVKQLSTGSLPQEAVGITFDDAYRDNLVHANPILTGRQIPATLFVPTGYLGHTSNFWWDELASMILANNMPVKFDQHCGAETLRMEWGSPESYDISGLWRASNPPRTARQRTYLAVWRKLQRTSYTEREHVMHSLRHSLGTANDQLARALNTEELSDLLSDGLVNLGAHTVSHPLLTSLSSDEVRREVRDSRVRCRELSTLPVQGFAFPYGDMNAQVRQEVASAGFLWACSTRHEFADEPEPDLFALPRIAVPNVRAWKFARLITSL